ncbi:MAG TPA: O-antigen ligase family protein, partial [Nitrospira sp.]|nr:O-antigen ligase family protein [Nitrospira sp.]
RSQVQIRLLLFVVTGMGMFEGLWGITQYLWLGETRAHGTFFNPNFFAAYETAVLLLSLGLLLFPRCEALSPSYKRWLWGTAAVSLTAFMTAQSRGAAFALLGGLSFLAFCRYGKKAFVILSVGLLASLLVPNPLQHRIAHVAEDPYAYTRLDIWKSSVVRLLEHPLGIGVGMYKQGSFQDRFPIEGDIVRYRKRPESAHNEYLQIGVELGVVGLALLFCGAGLWTAEVGQLLRKPVEKFDRGLSMGLTAAALVLLLHGAVDSSFHEPALVILLLLMGGLVHNLYIRSRPESVIWRCIGFSYHPLRAVYVLAGAAIMAAICAQSAVAWYAHDEGKRHAAQDDLEEALAWYVYAADIDPGTTGYHDSIARTAMQLHSESGKSEWLVTAAEEETVAKKLNNLDGRFAFRLGTIYRLMAVKALTSAQRAELLSKASEAFSEAIQSDPYSPFSYFELAQIRLAEGRVEEALTLLTTATTHEPNFLPGRALLAEQSLRAGIPGAYQQEYAAIKAVRSKYAHRELNETERRFLDVDLYPLGRAVAMESKR